MVENKWVLVPCCGNYLTGVDKGGGQAQVSPSSIAWPICDVGTNLPEKTPSLHPAHSEPGCPSVVWCSGSRLHSTMAVTACQGLGFVVSLIGIAGIIAATCMDQWSTQDLYNNPVTAVFNYQGLWRSCVRESSGFTECRGYFTLLGLPGKVCAVGRQGDGGRRLGHHRGMAEEWGAAATNTRVRTGVQQP